MINQLTILSIYSPGGPRDRCVETILERRLSLIHSTLAGAKKRPFVNPQPFYVGGGCVNPYHSYAGEALQTPTISMLAGLQRAPERVAFLHPEKCPTSPDFRSQFPGHFSHFIGSFISFSSQNPPVEGSEKDRVFSLEMNIQRFSACSSSPWAAPGNGSARRRPRPSANG
jgi:hypothetical protein